jgi:demethylmenaquinone methyltransferase / 2-methoxy-6-polyprenyl-1,4-benzoquinol methylase
MKATPYNIVGKTKADEVELMFNNIAPKYDLLNNLLSVGIDKIWRKKVSKLLSQEVKSVLDVATGTGELAIELSKNKNLNITGIDISQGMLDVGNVKINERDLSSRITLIKADSEKLPFKDNSFDATTVAFGVRNFEHLEQGLIEMKRVIKTGGKIIILEFSKPKNFPIKQLFGFYFKTIMPALGKTISKDSRAYNYLPESVQEFPEGEEFLNVLKTCGFKNCKSTKLSFGIASIYSATK